MDTAKIKKEITEYIKNADERFLLLVYSMVKADQVVGSGAENVAEIKKDDAVTSKSEAEIKREKFIKWIENSPKDLPIS